MKIVSLVLALKFVAASFTVSGEEVERILENSEVWNSPNGTSGVVLTHDSPCESETGAKKKMAGLTRAIFKESLLLFPEKIDRSQINGLPLYQITGISYANGAENNYRLLIAFGQRETLFIHAFAPKGEEIPNPALHFEINDEPLEFAIPAIDFAVSLMGGMIERFQIEIRMIVKQETGETINSGQSKFLESELYGEWKHEYNLPSNVIYKGITIYRSDNTFSDTSDIFRGEEKIDSVNTKGIWSVDGKNLILKMKVNEGEDTVVSAVLMTTSDKHYSYEQNGLILYETRINKYVEQAD